MNLEKLQKQLTLDEGLRLRIYQDTAGNWTVGLGHNLSSDGISMAVAQQLFTEDVALAIKRLNTIFPAWSKLDDVRQRVFVDLAFNLGEKLAEFRQMLAAAAAQDWPTAASHLRASHWYTQVGARGPRLVTMLETGQDVSF